MTELSFRLIQLTQDRVTIVDQELCDKLNSVRWCASFAPCINGFYATRGTSGPRGRSVTIRMHDLIMKPRRGYEIDHINGNTLDNRRCNLREVTKRQSALNRKVRRDNTSGVSGVQLNKKTKKWMSFISIDGMWKYLGSRPTFEEAVEVRRAAEFKYYGDYMRGVNAPPIPDLANVKREPRAPLVLNKSGHRNIVFTSTGVKVVGCWKGRNRYLGHYKDLNKALAVRDAFDRGERVKLPKNRINNTTGEHGISRVANGYAVEIMRNYKRLRKSGIRTIKEARVVRKAFIGTLES
jgi:hypothetical protein